MSSVYKFRHAPFVPPAIEKGIPIPASRAPGVRIKKPKARPSRYETGGVSWWDVLGVSINATEEQLNDAYRAKAKILHPDVGGSAEEFAKLNEAYRMATCQKVNP